MTKTAKPRRRRFINILGVKVKIKYTNKVLYDGDDLLHGSFCADNMTIHVSTTGDEKSIKSILYHECLHAALAISGVGNLLNLKTEEAIVSMLESALNEHFFF